MNNNLKAVCGTLAGVMVGGLTVVGANQAIQAMQNTEIKISLNGQVQEFKDETTGETQYPITYNNRTYLPLRNVAKLSGLNVDYDNNSNTAILSNKGYTSEQLVELAKEYYTLNSKSSYVPKNVVVDNESGDVVTIHLFDDMDTHVATSDWYLVNRYTGKGENILEEEIDISRENINRLKNLSVENIFDDILTYDNRTGNFKSIRKLVLDGETIYSCCTGEGSQHIEIYDEFGKLLYSDNGDFGASDIYETEDGKLYYYEFNLVDGKEPDEDQYEKFYLKYKDNKVTSYQETSKEILNSETMSETITRFVKEYGEQNPDFMISELVWGYKDYISYRKDGYIINIYYSNGKIKAEVNANTYVDSQDKTRKIQSSSNKVAYNDFLYRIAKVGNPEISKEKINEVYSDLEQGKYGHKSLSNVKEIDNVTFNYYNYGQYFSTSVEFDFKSK